MDKSTARSRHLDSMRRACLWALLLILLLVLNAPDPTYAQVVTNITPSALPPCPGPCGAGVTIVTAPSTGGTVTTITGGARPGNGPNLFHSFGQFNVGTGDIANFFNETGLPTSNILSRVTGGNQSQIYGTIQTTGFDSANLFLVNPSGIVFGPNGSVNVGGSVSFSTAQYLRLSDGVDSANFYANPASDGLANSILVVDPVVNFGFLSSAAPAAYGFLTPPSPNATISVQSSTLSVPQAPADAPPNSISLVGGKVVLEGGAQLSAPSGRIHLATAASPGEFDVATLQPLPNVDGTAFTSFGSVSLAPGSSIDVSGANTVWVKGGQLMLSVNDAMLSTSENPVTPDTISLSPGSSIVTSNSGADPGADVQITVEAVQMDGAMIQSIDSGDLDGGNILINASIVSLANGTSILSSTGLDFTTGTSVGSGNGGNVSIQGIQGAGSAADSVVLSGASQIRSVTFGSGRGGATSITAAKSLVMNEFATISTGGFGTGRPGDILLSVQQASLTSGASISPARVPIPDLDLGLPSTGNVTVQGLQGSGSKADSLILEGSAGIISQIEGRGRAGDIDVHAKTVSLKDGAAIHSGNPLTGSSGGNVTIDADSVSLASGSSITSQALDLAGGRVTITAEQLTLNNSLIDTSTLGISRGGDVALNAGTVNLTNGATINSSTVAAGPAGDINILAIESVTMTDGSAISASSSSFGNAGNINIQTIGSVTMTDGSAISASSIDLANAGNITITALGPFTSNASTIKTSAENARGGDIDMTAQSVALSNGAAISASSRSPLLPDGGGNAGTITINAGSEFLSTNSSVTTEATQASGGNITLLASDMIRLQNSQINASVSGETQTAGGNVMIDPQFVILQNSQIIARASAGSGGTINVTAGVFIADPASIVDASAKSGNSGTVSIQSPVQNLSGQLTPLSQQFSSAAALLLASRCAADPTGQFSSFVQTGRDGVPQVPGALSPSPLSFLETLTSGSWGSQVPNWAAARLGLDSVSFDDSTRFHAACRS